MTTSETADTTDEQLLALFNKGGRGGAAALGELARRYEAPLLGLAMGLLGGPPRADLARDAVQDSWVRVIKYGKGFSGNSTVKTWLYRIVINRCRDIREQAGRDQHQSGQVTGTGEVSPDAGASHAELNGQLRTAVGGLGAPTRLLLLLCYHQGLTHDQAAEVLGIPTGTLKSRLSAALAELRGRLGTGARP